MKKILLLGVTVLLLLCCIFNIFAEPAVVGSAFVLADGAGAGDVLSSDSDGAEHISAAELLAVFTSETISEAEALYVNRMSSISLVYNVKISTENIKIIYPDGSDMIYVYADEYTAPAPKTGIEVTWRPVSVSCGSVTADFEIGSGDHPYSASLAYDSSNKAVTVNYETVFVFSKDAVNELISMSYAAAVKAASDRAEYEVLLAEFKEKKSVYEKYLTDLAEFETKLLPEYTAYLAECERLTKEHELLMKEYEEYKIEFQKELEEYARQMEEFEIKEAEYNTYINVTKPEFDKAYDAHLEYLDAMEDWKAENKKYEYYEEYAPKYNKHLEIINTAKTPMTDGRTLYGAIMGDTVTTVLKRQDEIVSAGAPKNLVIQANNATNKLRTVFEGYFGCTTDEERYAYYQKHYSAFKEASISLLQALDYFYKMNGGTGIVYMKLVQEEKAKKYVILLAQLYIFATALSDEDVYNYEGTKKFTDSYTWTYSQNLSEHNSGKKYTVTPVAMLEGNRYLTDTNSAAPFSDPYPKYVEKPIMPDFVPKPDDIEKVTQPTKPTEPQLLPAPELTLPDYMEEPDAPDFVEDPGDEPENPVDEYEELLLDAMQAGELNGEREEHTEDFSLTKTASINRDVIPQDCAVVYFYESKEPGAAFSNAFAEKDGEVEFGSDRLDCEDEDFYYELVGWSYKDGTAADLSDIGTGHVYLYPEFEAYEKSEYCSVIWNIDGKETKTYIKNGDEPVYEGIPEKAETDEGVYVFKGWSGPVLNSDGDPVYTAKFTFIKYNYSVEWKVDGEIFKEEMCPNAQTPKSPLTLGEIVKKDSEYWYIFNGWDKELSPIDGADASYEAKIEKVRYFIVSFCIEGGTVIRTLECEAGTVPSIPEDIKNEGALLMRGLKYDYFLVKWGEEAQAPVLSDVTLKAQTRREYIYPVSGGGANITVTEKTLIVDISDFDLNEISEITALAELADGKDVTVKTKIGTFTFSNDTVLKMLDDEAGRIAFSSGEKYSIGIFDIDGVKITQEKTDLYRIYAEFVLGAMPEPAIGGTMHFVELDSEGGYEPIEFSASDGAFSVSGIRPNKDHVFSELFLINLHANGEWISLKSAAKEGERVEILLDLPEGKLVDELYFVFADQRQEITGGSFVMPMGDVEIFATSKFKEFTVKFVLFDGTQIEQTCTWGDTPVPPSIEQKILVSPYVYTFEGWDKESAPVFSDTVYTCVYSEPEYIYPCGNGGADISYPYGRFVADISGCGTNVIPDFAALSELCGERLMIIKTADAQLSIPRDTVERMLEDGVCEITIYTPSLGTQGYSVVLTDKDGAYISAEKAALYVLGAEFNRDALPEPEYGGTVSFVAMSEDGTYMLADSYFSGGILKIEGMMPGVRHTYVELFDINISQDEEWITVKALNAKAMAGERVEFIKTLPVGMTIKNLYYVLEDADGEKIQMDGESFIMPLGDIRISVSLKPIEFTIKFMLYDGTYIEEICTWGATPVMPAIQKGLDSTYIYTFIGWDREAVPAFEDAVYTAIYEKSPIEGDNYNKGNFWLLYLITVFRFRIAVMVSVAVSLLSAIAFTLFKIYRKKHPIS